MRVFAGSLSFRNIYIGLHWAVHKNNYVTGLATGNFFVLFFYCFFLSLLICFCIFPPLVRKQTFLMDSLAMAFRLF